MGKRRFTCSTVTDVVDVPIVIQRKKTIEHGLENVNSIDTVSDKTYISNENTLKLWNVNDDSTDTRTCPIKRTGIVKMRASKYDLVYMACRKDKLVLFDVETGKDARCPMKSGQDEFNDDTLCTGLVVDDDKSMLYSCWDNGYVIETDLRIPKESGYHSVHSDSILSMDIGDNKLWTSGRDRFVRCKDLRFDAGFLFEKQFKENITALKYSPNSSIVALGTESGVAILYQRNLDLAYVEKFGNSEIGCLVQSVSGQWILLAIDRTLVISETMCPNRYVLFTRIARNPVKMFSLCPNDIFLTIIDNSLDALVCTLIY